MTQLYLVRHAKAGERRLWTGDDIERPLSKKGWRQSEQIGKRLAKLHPALLLSSPYVRCIQTLEPLAARLGATVEVDVRLAEDASVDPVLELLGELRRDTVMCSHGDIIPATIYCLKQQGTKLETPADWRKSSVWVLTRDRSGDIVHATVWPPPKV
jgi:phosphohistidine phosphatase SixA